MKKLAFGALAAAAMATLMGCSTVNQANNNEPAVGMANPASEFCIKQGGKLEIRKDQAGNEYGMCHLPNGQIVEEWDYFRKHSK